MRWRSLLLLGGAIAGSACGQFLGVDEEPQPVVDASVGADVTTSEGGSDGATDLDAGVDAPVVPEVCTPPCTGGLACTKQMCVPTGCLFGQKAVIIPLTLFASDSEIGKVVFAPAGGGLANLTDLGPNETVASSTQAGVSLYIEHAPVAAPSGTTTLKKAVVRAVARLNGGAGRISLGLAKAGSATLVPQNLSAQYFDYITDVSFDPSVGVLWPAPSAIDPYRVTVVFDGNTSEPSEVRVTHVRLEACFE